MSRRSGRQQHGPGMPRVSEGRAPSTPDEVAVSSTLGQHVGDEIQVGVRTLRVVGIVPNSTALAKMPNVFLTTEGVQQLAYNGQPIDHVDRDPRHAPAAPGRLPDRRSSSRCQRPDARGEGRGGCDHDRGCFAVDRGGVDRRVGCLPLRARAPARLCGVQSDWRACAVDPGGAGAAGGRRRAARGGAGRRSFRGCWHRCSRCSSWCLRVPTSRYRWWRLWSVCWPALPDSGARWPSIRRLRLEVPKRWAI